MNILEKREKIYLSLLKKNLLEEYSEDSIQEVNVISQINDVKLPCIEPKTLSTTCVTLKLNNGFEKLNPNEIFELMNAIREKKTFHYKDYQLYYFSNSPQIKYIIKSS